MKPQTIFNKVVKHLLSQKRKAKRPGGDCVYRNEKGLKCAVGCLIPDRLYEPAMEGGAPYDLLVWGNTCEFGKLIGMENEELLNELQQVHDDYHPNAWPKQLKALAEREGLKFNAP